MIELKRISDSHVQAVDGKKENQRELVSQRIKSELLSKIIR